METSKLSTDRMNLLADIAEMYFIQGKNQADIAEVVGVTRSNISRMLTEARKEGIIDFTINRPLKEDTSFAQLIINRFDLLNARIVHVDHKSTLLNKLGQVASEELVQHLKPDCIVGTSWGTAISATVENLHLENPIQNLRVTQLVGALGARIKEYDGHAIVRRLEDKLDAEGIYINAPFLVEDTRTAKSLMQNKSIKESLSISSQADLALCGIGSSDLQSSSYFLADYVSYDEMIAIQNAGAIGDVCGRFFTIEGKNTAIEFQDRMIGISLTNLKNIPIRIGVAGGPKKVQPIIGALKSRLINILISDTATVTEVLKHS